MITHIERQAASTTSPTQFCYEDPHLQISRAERLVVLNSHSLDLRPKEYELLALLAANVGEVVPRAVLLSQVWGYGVGIRTRTLDVHILREERWGNHQLSIAAGPAQRIEIYRPHPHRRARHWHAAAGHSPRRRAQIVRRGKSAPRAVEKTPRAIFSHFLLQLCRRSGPEPLPRPHWRGP